MAALIWSHFLFNNWFYSTTVLFNCLFTLLFNFLFRWLPLFGCTFYSTTGFIQQLFCSTAYSLPYSTFYSDGRPYLVALFIQQLVLFNNCFIQLLIHSLIQLFIPMAALIWSHFLFNFLFLFNLNDLLTLILSLLQLIYFFFFFFFFFGKKGVLPGFEPGTS